MSNHTSSREAVTSRPHGVGREIPDTQLIALAQLHGVEPSYVDAAGKSREVLPGTLRGVLAALGIDARTDDSIRTEIEYSRSREWIRPLPSVTVLSQRAGRIEIDIVLPSGTPKVAWRLELEDGTSLRGETAFPDLPLSAEHSVPGALLERRKLSLPQAIPPGYHQFSIAGAEAGCRLIVSPGRCWLPDPAPERGRLWGVAAQLYSVRTERNWGMGDFTDLRELLSRAADQNIDIVGINPVHALFPDYPEQASPYSPSSRQFLNVMYVDVTAAPGFEESREAQDVVADSHFRAQLAECRKSDQVKYTAIWELKLRVLRVLYSHAKAHGDAPTWREFEDYRRAQGNALERAGRFAALRNHFGSHDTSKVDWRKWPAAFQDPESPEVVELAASHGEEIAFHAWLQWVADRQLQQACASAESLRIGLFRDLAVGTDSAGAECWSNPVARVEAATVGAPPDLFQADGQNWGLAPLHPARLREEAYATFIELLRANMRYAGALRIDHAMSLQQLYWIPSGAPASQGAYVRYPLEDLIGIIALESHRNRCIVVGEDLGTVPAGFPERMEEAAILSYRVLPFEREADGTFLPSDRYPECALAMASNHDLPTVTGWYQGRDIEIRQELVSDVPAERIEQDLQKRRQDCELLRSALAQEGLLDRSAGASAEKVLLAVHAFLLRTPCLVAMLQLDDLARETDAVNVPGVPRYPSWRRRLSRTLADLFDDRERWPS